MTVWNRGKYKQKHPGARGLAQLMQHPTCDRLAVMVMESLPVSEVRREIFGEKEEEAESPFAIQRGNRFDHRMSKAHGAALVEVYHKRGWLTRQESISVNLAEECPGSNRQALEQRKQRTLHYLGQKRANAPGAPHILLKPRLSVEIAGRVFTIEPDYLVASSEDQHYRIGEIKSYPDRGGQSDGHKLAKACMQSAVAALAYRQWLEAQGDKGRPPAQGDLVLTKPNSLQPSLRRLSIVEEWEQLEGLVAAMPQRLAEIGAHLSKAVDEGGTSILCLDNAEVFRRLPAPYRAHCTQFCGLAQACREEACTRGDVAVLGDMAARQWGNTHNLHQLLALLQGETEAANSDEEALGQALRHTEQRYKEVI